MRSGIPNLRWPGRFLPARYWPVALLGGLLVAGLAGITLFRSHGSAKPDTGLLTVKAAPFQVVVKGDGEIVPERQLLIRSPYSGVVEKLAPDGTSVKAGDFIAQMGTRQLDERRRPAQRALDRAKSELAQHEQAGRSERLKQRALVQAATRAVELRRMELAALIKGADPLRLRDLELSYQVAARAYQTAKEGANQKERLAKRNLIKGTDLLDARLDLLSGHKEMAIAQAKRDLLRQGATRLDLELGRLALRKAQADLAIAHANEAAFEAKQKLERRKFETQISFRQSQVADVDREAQRARITAPIAGVLTWRKIWSSTGNTTIKGGDRVWRGQAFLAVADASKLNVAVEVEEQEISWVKPGTAARITLPSDKSHSFLGQVATVSAMAVTSRRDGPEGGPKVFETILSVDSPKGFKPGLTAEVEFVKERLPSALAIPVAAVRRDADHLYVEMANRSKRAVRLGARNADQVVVQSGLAAGDRIRSSPKEAAE